MCMTGSAFVEPDLRSQRPFSSFLPTKEQPDNQQEALDVAQGDTYLVSHSFFLIIFLTKKFSFSQRRIKLPKKSFLEAHTISVSLAGAT